MERKRSCIRIPTAPAPDAGLVVNAVMMWLLHGDSKHDLNIRGAFPHILGDALSSVGIIIGGAAKRP